MQIFKKLLQKWGRTFFIGIFLILAFVAGNTTGFAQNRHTPQTQVLGTSNSVTPSPTLMVPTGVPVTVINNIILPTQTPTVVNQLTPTPTQVPAPIVEPTVSPLPTIFPTATPTPTPVAQTIIIDIDYAGVHAESTYTVSITPNETAWQAVQEGLGIANIAYTDYGGSLGIFITGFNGVSADTNQYYDFQVNGASSMVGVSSYIVNDHDILKFVLTSF